MVKQGLIMSTAEQGNSDCNTQAMIHHHAVANIQSTTAQNNQSNATVAIYVLSTDCDSTQCTPKGTKFQLNPVKSYGAIPTVLMASLDLAGVTQTSNSLLAAPTALMRFKSTETLAINKPPNEITKPRDNSQATFQKHKIPVTEKSINGGKVVVRT